MPESTQQSGARSPEYALLGFLYAGADHGYALHQRLIDEFGYIWHVSQSQTYTILKRLEKDGCVTSTTQAQDKLPARQLLQLTPAGRRRFEAWLGASGKGSMRQVRVELIPRLYFLQKYHPERLGAVLEAQTGGVEQALDRLRAQRKSLPRARTFDRLSLDLRIRELRAVRDWLARCGETLKKSS
jgi:DNA-binding PadR family transcriptional regulator